MAVAGPDGGAPQVSARVEVRSAAPPKPIDIPQAQKAHGELQKASGGAFSLNQLRKMDAPALLDAGDPAQNKEPGVLNKAGWKKDEPTKDYLDNAKRYAQEQAQKGLAELLEMKQAGVVLTQEQLAKLKPDEVIALAKANGRAVEDVPSDAAKTAEAQKMRDYLENAHGLAVEEQSKKDAVVEATVNIVATAEAGKKSGVSHEALEILATMGEKSGMSAAVQRRGGELVQQGVKEGDANLTAFGIDMQVAGIKQEYQELSDRNITAQRNVDTKTMTLTYKKMTELSARRTSLEAQRKSGKVQVMEAQADGTTKPVDHDVPGMPPENTITQIALMMGVDAKAATENPLGNIYSIVGASVSSSTARRDLIQSMRTAGFGEVETAKMDSLLGGLAKRAANEKTKGMVQNISIIALLLMLMGGYAAFQKNKAAQGASMGQS